MARRLKMEFEKGGEIVAEFLEKEAPITCQLLWEQLPLDMTFHNCMGCGREIYSDELPINAPVPEENLVHRGFLGCGATVAAEGSEYLTQLAQYGLTTLCFVWGKDQMFRQDMEQSNLATHFLQIKEDLATFTRICHRIRIHGKERVHLSGYEE